MALEALKPGQVFKHFEQLSSIPRGSGNERQVCEWICSFAKDRGFWAIKDDSNNTIAKKPGTKGLEGRPPVILQAHVDMVCEKNADSEHDFLKDGIKLIVDGDDLHADGTTLGADNGIGVAMMLAILDSKDIAHPPLELVFTSDEETGMSGARNLDASVLAGRRLINLDSEEEGVFCASCAGGMRTTVELPLDKIELPASYGLFSLKVKGLKGGHSGVDINKGRGNSNQLLGRVLRALVKEGAWIQSVSGGSKENALPRESEAVIAFAREQFDLMARVVFEHDTVFKKELRATDPGVALELAPAEILERSALGEECANKAISLLLSLPSGVKSMSFYIPDLVETSSSLSVVETTGQVIRYHISLRSSVETRKWALKEVVEAVSDLAGAKFEMGASYPEWEFNPDSPLRKAAIEAWESQGRTAKVEAIHAGLECGLFSRMLPGADMISLGPDMFDVHSPQERLSISSTERVWSFLQRLLAAL
ncbi:MAG: aminoacyl-histidine dipeptidase [Clostridiales bacterium]|nr:aminoacyl-histidine dipeptidase [Clostridiales bacterium]